jgi:hypothetical protein
MAGLAIGKFDMGTKLPLFHPALEVNGRLGKI